MSIFSKDKLKTLIIWTFISIPFLSSLISTVHLVDMFALGNYSWMAYVLAISFELGSIASLLILTILDKVNRGMVTTIFIILTAMNILGNIYFSFDYISVQLMTDPNWLGSFQELVSFFVAGDVVLMKFVVSLLVGVPIPLISLFFLKSLIDYLTVDNDDVDEIKESSVDIDDDISTTSHDISTTGIKRYNLPNNLKIDSDFITPPRVNISEDELKNEMEYISKDMVLDEPENEIENIPPSVAVLQNNTPK